MGGRGRVRPTDPRLPCLLRLRCAVIVLALRLHRLPVPAPSPRTPPHGQAPQQPRSRLNDVTLSERRGMEPSPLLGNAPESYAFVKAKPPNRHLGRSFCRNSVPILKHPRDALPSRRRRLEECSHAANQSLIDGPVECHVGRKELACLTLSIKNFGEPRNRSLSRTKLSIASATGQRSCPPTESLRSPW